MRSLRGQAFMTPDLCQFFHHAIDFMNCKTIICLGCLNMLSELKINLRIKEHKLFRNTICCSKYSSFAVDSLYC